jgi:hypothetical protein
VAEAAGQLRQRSSSPRRSSRSATRRSVCNGGGRREHRRSDLGAGRELPGRGENPRRQLLAGHLVHPGGSVQGLTRSFGALVYGARPQEGISYSLGGDLDLSDAIRRDAGEPHPLRTNSAAA